MGPAYFRFRLISSPPSGVFFGRPTGRGRTRRPSRVSSLLTKRSLPKRPARVRPQPNLGHFRVGQSFRQFLPPCRQR